MIISKFELSLLYSFACVNMSKIDSIILPPTINSARSYRVWRITDSNRWPPACKAGALANWANPPREKREEILKKHLHELMSPSRNWNLEHIRPSRCVVPGRLELPTSTLSVWRSNQLSYRTNFRAQCLSKILGISNSPASFFSLYRKTDLRSTRRKQTISSEHLSSKKNTNLNKAQHKC